MSLPVPTEIVEIILRYLDQESLFVCAITSASLRKIVLSLDIELDVDENSTLTVVRFKRAKYNIRFSYSRRLALSKYIKRRRVVGITSKHLELPNIRLCKYKQLRRLDINFIKTDQLKKLKELKELKSLSLRLREYQGVVVSSLNLDELVLKEIVNERELALCSQATSVSMCYVRIAGIPLSKFNRLTCLDISSSRFNGKNLRYLNLEMLSLVFVKVTTDDIKHMSKLKKLRLTETGVTDIRMLTNLRTLSLESDNMFTNEALKVMTNLTHLDLSFNYNIREYSLKSLVNIKKIVRENPGRVSLLMRS